jgi:hypothetical protein
MINLIELLNFVVKLTLSIFSLLLKLLVGLLVVLGWLLIFLVEVTLGIVRDHNWLLIHQLLSLVSIASLDSKYGHHK